MNVPNVDKAWSILTESVGADRPENRTAFIAALIFERVSYAAPKGTDAREITPLIAEAFATELVALATKIHRLAEANCNYGLSKGQENRLARLEGRFTDIAEALGFEARTGGDPRGACAYLIDPANRQGDGWGEGWAVYR